MRRMRERRVPGCVNAPGEWNDRFNQAYGPNRAELIDRVSPAVGTRSAARGDWLRVAKVRGVVYHRGVGCVPATLPVTSAALSKG